MSELRHHGDDAGAHHRACSCGTCYDCAAFQAYEHERARLKAKALNEDKRDRLLAAEIRDGWQARRWLNSLKDVWHDEIRARFEEPG